MAYSEEEISQNLQKCPSFDTCSQNFCPLDLELHLRTGGEADKCKWMREGIKYSKKGSQMRNLGKYSGEPLKEGEFIGGGKTIPNGLLNFVPKNNVKRLNEASQKQWNKIRKQGLTRKF
jgi:hypothetical protein